MIFKGTLKPPGRAMAPPSPLIAEPNVTAHPSTASVPPFDVAL